jgi:hypothetical protein
VTTAQFGLLGTVFGAVWFAVIVLATMWAQRSEGST